MATTTRERSFVLGLVLAVVPAAGAACPFCGVVAEPLSWRRDRAAVVVVAESAGPADRIDGALTQPLGILQVIRTLPGAGPPPEGVVLAGVRAPIAGTALAFAAAQPGADGGGRLAWEGIAADEPLIAHVAAAPATSLPAAERLRWFAGRLEHPDAAVAADSFAEFAIAPFAAVRAAAGSFDADSLRAWVAEPAIDPSRRGFYGLALGLVAATTADATVRETAVAALRAAVAAAADDFRAGYDGILAGMLVAEGAHGLDWIEDRGLTLRAPRPLDQKHLLAALRFAWEELGGSVPPARVAAATRRLLAAPVVAAEAAVDLARYQAWDAVDDVAALWETDGDDPLVRRAVAGFLVACPTDRGRHRLEELRSRDPVRFAAAVAAAALPPSR